MGNLRITDFRALMGEHNLGNVIIKEDKKGNKSLSTVNSHAHKWWKNNIPSDGAKNSTVRQAFYNAIHTYVQSKGYNLADEDGAASKFMEQIREDLLGANKKTADLSRSADIARLLDKLDVALETGQFNIRRDNGNVSLADRFVFSVEAPKPDSQTNKPKAFIAKSIQKAANATLQTLRNTLSPRPGQNAFDPDQLDKNLLKTLSNATGLSKIQIKSYVASRQESLLLEAGKSLNAILKEFVDGKKDLTTKDLRGLMSATSRTKLADLALAKALTQLHKTTLTAKSIASFKGATRQVADVMLALDSIPIDNIGNNGELNALLPALDRLQANPGTPVTVKICGVRVTLSTAGDHLKVRLGDVSFDSPYSAATFLQMLEDAVSITTGIDPKRLINLLNDTSDDSYLAARGDAGKSYQRRNTLLIGMLNKRLGLNEVDLLSLSNEELAAAVNDQKSTPEQTKAKILNLINSRVYPKPVQELIAGNVGADNVKIIRPDDQPQKDLTLKDLAADLFANDEVWLMDQADAGKRLASTLIKHQTAVKDLLGKNENDRKTALKAIQLFPDGNSELNASLTAPLMQLLQKLDELQAGGESLESICNNRPNELAGIEDAITVTTLKTLATLQNLLNDNLHPDAQGDVQGVQDNRAPWQKSLPEILNEQKHSTHAAEGRFFNKLLSEYIARAPEMEQRAMLASLLRSGSKESSLSEKFSALLKGAGPIFQKILQGIPEDQVPDILRAALTDMKSNLAPIPEKAVKAQLGKMIADSNGAIETITVRKALGSASVGQAFLCTIKYADPARGEKNVVIKMLKPDVQTRFAREQALIRKMAAEVDPSFAKTYETRLSTIRDELNFKSEKSNVLAGAKVYRGKTNDVTTASVVTEIASGINMLVLEVADGDPVDRFLSNEVAPELDQIQDGCELLTDPQTGRKKRIPPSVSDYCKKRNQLTKLSQKLVQCEANLKNFAMTWFNEAIFGSGYFHGDPHSGNIMFKAGEAGGSGYVTMIDFGNAMKLSKDERKHLMKMTCAAAAGSVNDFMDALKALLKLTGGGHSRLDEDNYKKEYENFLAEMFAKGQVGDTDMRLLAAINKLQNDQVAIPSAVYNFLAAQNRLKNSLDEVAAQHQKVTELLSTLTPPDLPSEITDCELGYEFTDAPAPALYVLNDLVSHGSGYSFFEDSLSTATEKLSKKKGELVDEGVQDWHEDGEKFKRLLTASIACFSDYFEDGELKTQFTNAQAAWEQDPSEKNLRDLLSKFYDLQLRFVNEVRKANDHTHLPPPPNLGNAIVDVIGSKLCDNFGTEDEELKKIDAGIFSLKYDISTSLSTQLGNKIQGLRDEATRTKKQFSGAVVTTFIVPGGKYAHVGLNISQNDMAEFNRLKSRAFELKFSADMLKKLNGKTAWSKTDLKTLLTQITYNLKKFLHEDARLGKTLSNRIRKECRRTFDQNEKLSKADALETKIQEDQTNPKAYSAQSTSFFLPLYYFGYIMNDKIFDNVFKNEACTQTLNEILTEQDFLNKLEDPEPLTDNELAQIAENQWEDYCYAKGLDKTADKAGNFEAFKELCASEYKNDMKRIAELILVFLQKGAAKTYG